MFTVFGTLALPKVSYAKCRSVGASYMGESWRQYEYRCWVRGGKNRLIDAVST